MENAWERRGEMSAPPVAGANETHQFPPYTIFYHLYLPSLRIFSHDLSLLKNFFWVGRKHWEVHGWWDYRDSWYRSSIYPVFKQVHFFTASTRLCVCTVVVLYSATMWRGSSKSYHKIIIIMSFTCPLTITLINERYYCIAVALYSIWFICTDCVNISSHPYRVHLNSPLSLSLLLPISL